MVYISANISLFPVDTMMEGGGIHLDMLINFFLQQQEKQADLSNKP
jgi:hypothetical protein